MSRRGRRREEFNPFARDASEQHRRRRTERMEAARPIITQNLNQEPTPEVNTQGGSSEKRKRYHHKQIKSPRSPELSVERNSVLETRTKETREFVKDHQNSDSIKTDTMLINLSNIEDVLDKLNKEIDEEINRTLRKEIQENKASLDDLMKKYGIDPTDWSAISTNEVIAILFRRIHVIEYEIYKNANNGFLKSFNIGSLPSNHLRSLCGLNERLSEIKSAYHAGDGKIFVFRNGVRVVLDSRRTIQSSLDGSREIWAYVGPEHKRVCLRGSLMGGDSIWTMLLIHRNNWAQPFLESIDGDGTLSIVYQLKRWESSNYTNYLKIIEDYYERQSILIRSVEVYEEISTIIISPQNNEQIGKLIGKNGIHSKKITKLVEKLGNKKWHVRIESLI